MAPKPGTYKEASGAGNQVITGVYEMPLLVLYAAGIWGCLSIIKYIWSFKFMAPNKDGMGLCHMHINECSNTVKK